MLKSQPISLFLILIFGLFVFFDCQAKPKTMKECGFNYADWCAVPLWDSCGSHKNESACRADSNCRGIYYQGESYVPCVYDERGFGKNCPTVGCVSRCDLLNKEKCEKYSSDAYPFCRWKEDKCIGKTLSNLNQSEL